MTGPVPSRRRNLGWRAALACAVLGGVALLLAWPRPEEDIHREIIAALRAELTPAMIGQALDAGDADGAELLAEAAELAGIGVPKPIADRLAAEMVPWKQAARKAADCGKGAVLGQAAGVAGIACSVVADMTLLGDVRDATIELGKPLRGEEPDSLILGLAVAGLVLEVAAPATGSASLGAKGGTAVLKVGAKSRLIARRLLDEVGGVLSSAIRPGPLKALSPADLADVPRLRRAMGESVDLRRLAPLTQAGTSLARIAEKGALGDAVMVARTARTLDDVKTAEKLASVFGKRTGAVLKVLGAKAFDLVTLAVRLVWALLGLFFGALCWLVAGLIALRGIASFRGKLRTSR